MDQINVCSSRLANSYSLTANAHKRNWTARFVSLAVRFEWSMQTAEFCVRQLRLLYRYLAWSNCY